MNPKTKEILKQLKEILHQPSVEKWYGENMEKDSQANTIKTLTNGVSSGKLKIEEALSIAFLVGFQWNEKFEGVP